MFDLAVGEIDKKQPAKQIRRITDIEESEEESVHLGKWLPGHAGETVPMYLKIYAYLNTPYISYKLNSVATPRHPKPLLL